MTDTNLIEIFCIFDDFCKYFTPELKKHTLQVPGKRHRNRSSRMSDSEIMTILVLFHTHRFVERQAQVALHLLLFLQTCALGKCSGISIIDSTPLASWHIKRERKHRIMRGWTANGKYTMDWFYGFKLHLVINDKGEIIQWKLTPGNVDDRSH